MTFSDEKKRLINVANLLAEEKDSIALFMIYYTKEDSPVEIKHRVFLILKYLAEKYSIPENRINFVFANDVRARTRIYVQPSDAGFQNRNWKKDLQKLAEIKKSRKKK